MAQQWGALAAAFPEVLHAIANNYMPAITICCDLIEDLIPSSGMQVFMRSYPIFYFKSPKQSKFPVFPPPTEKGMSSTAQCNIPERHSTSSYLILHTSETRKLWWGSMKCDSFVDQRLWTNWAHPSAELSPKASKAIAYGKKYDILSN